MSFLRYVPKQVLAVGRFPPTPRRKVSLKTPTKEAEVKKPEKKRKPHTCDAEDSKQRFGGTLPTSPNSEAIANRVTSCATAASAPQSNKIWEGCTHRWMGRAWRTPKHRHHYTALVRILNEEQKQKGQKKHLQQPKPKEVWKEVKQ